MKRKNKRRRKQKEQGWFSSFSRRAKEWWADKNPVLVFLLVLTGLVVFFFLVNNFWFAGSTLHEGWMIINVSVSNFLLNLLGQNTIAQGTEISSSAFSINVSRGCDAVMPIALFIAAVLAYPASKDNKLTGIIFGITALYILNVVRIVTLFLVGVYWPSIFELMHVEVWQYIFIFISIMFYFFWIRRVKNELKIEMNA